jgi:urease accessory protein
MDGKMPETFLQGLLSGFGHPVIGVDHLAAIVGVGILAALAGRSAAVVLAFSVAVIAGVGLHLTEVDLPASELLVGLTTLLIGALVIARQSMGAGLALLLFAVAGLVHGYALGESIVGAEPSPLVAYLLGLLIIQSAIGVVVYAAVRTMAHWPARTAGLTTVGVLVALAGGIATASAAGLA